MRSTDPSDDKKRIEETKGGLLADSYRWVLDNATFQQWQRNPHSRLLWVKGISESLVCRLVECSTKLSCDNSYCVTMAL
jgi:hypothetical protein